MGVSRVDFGGETLVDLTSDTVMPQSLLSGYSAHNKAGELIEGLVAIPTVGNGTVTIKQNGASKGTFSMNQSGNTTIELTDNNTTYGAATQSTNGLMTSADKKKLDGLTPTTSLTVTQRGTSVLDGTVGKVLDDKIDAINSNFGGLSFGETEDGQPGYRKPGADTVIPFKSGFNEVAVYYSSNYNIYVQGKIIKRDGTYSDNGNYMEYKDVGNNLINIIAKRGGNYLIFTRFSTTVGYYNIIEKEKLSGEIIITITRGTEGLYCILAI